MKACITTTSFAVIVNGGPSFFQASHGLRQGYSLSPRLFLVVMEGLNTMIIKTRECGLFRGLRVGVRIGLRKQKSKGVFDVVEDVNGFNILKNR